MTFSQSLGHRPTRTLTSIFSHPKGAPAWALLFSFECQNRVHIVDPKTGPPATEGDVSLFTIYQQI